MAKYQCWWCAPDVHAQQEREAELEAELAECRATSDGLYAAVQMAQKEQEHLRAELERLRAGIRDFENLIYPDKLLVARLRELCGDYDENPDTA